MATNQTTVKAMDTLLHAHRFVYACQKEHRPILSRYWVQWYAPTTGALVVDWFWRRKDAKAFQEFCDANRIEVRDEIEVERDIEYEA